MNLANLLTCSRIVLTVLFTAFIFSPGPSGKILALFYFTLASLTDYWDGIVARRFKEESQFGKLMDPIADKLLTLSAFVNFWLLRLISVWTVTIVLARDVIVTAVRLMRRPQSEAQTVRSSGKQKTAFQFLYIIAVLVYLIVRESGSWQERWDGRALWSIRVGMWLVVLMTLFSGIRLILKNFSLPNKT